MGSFRRIAMRNVVFAGVASAIVLPAQPLANASFQVMTLPASPA
jgi:hypothetical protein